MKLFTLISLMLLGFAQFILPQDSVITPKDNAMSNVFGVTAEGGVTLGFTDYSTSKTDYTGKVSLEYYFPSTGMGSFGLRAFGQEGFVSGSGAQASWRNPTNEFSTRLDMYGGGMMYALSIDNSFYPWIGIGASNLWFYPKDGNGNQLPNFKEGNYSHYMLTINGDVGVRFMVSKSLSLNVNGGIIVASKDHLDDISSGSNSDLLYTATVGLSYYFGRAKDSDGDGVPDYMDNCPNTPVGVAVDATGCPLDSDGDGVPDYLDKCPNTPAGVQVDATGCPLDSDGDGVPDYLDKCPNTPAGVQVDSTGCPIKKAQDTVVVTQPAEIESLVLSGDANFEFNKSKLLSNAYAVLDSLVGTMKAHPEYKWEVGGYTDGIGSASYNKKLSQRRAQSVVDYLVSQGVSRNDLKIVGYGKDDPIATNSTDEGRAMNRRVEIKLLSKGN
jgi:OOP family OmpA-OmpF porin